MAEMDHNHGFTDYETTTIDPGWGFTTIIIVICIGINLTLPLWLRLGDFCTCCRKVDEKDEVHNNKSSGNNNSGNEKKNDADAPRSTLSGPASCHSKNLVGHRHRHYLHNRPGPGSVSASVVSFASSANFTDSASAILAARPTRSRLPDHRRKKKLMLATNKRNLRLAAELATAEHAWRRIASAEDTNVTGRTADGRSDAAPSVMSQLDVDAISTRDAVDAKDIGVMSMSKINDINTVHTYAWDKLLQIADWDKEMKKFVSLAFHFSLQGLSIQIFDIVNVAIVGHFVGVKQANAFVVVSILLEFTTTLTTGFAECKCTVVPSQQKEAAILILSFSDMLLEFHLNRH
jgi:hypothetical protein